MNQTYILLGFVRIPVTEISTVNPPNIKAQQHSMKGILFLFFKISCLTKYKNINAKNILKTQVYTRTKDP